MEKTLTTLAKLISNNSPKDHEHHIKVDKVFLPGATEEEINMTEEYLDCKFPSAIRELYKHVNG